MQDVPLASALSTMSNPCVCPASLLLYHANTSLVSLCSNYAASAVTFLETCSFEDIQECGMILSASGNASWERVGSVQEGPNSDQTKLGPLCGKPPCYNR